MTQPVMEGQPELPAQPAAAQPAVTNGIDRYRVLRNLGQGAYGFVV
jgi:hypothetical protein